MRLILSILLALFMAAGPVLSAAANLSMPQTQDTTTDHHTHHMATQHDTGTMENGHSCCDQDCQCAFPLQCDFQQLSFHALSPRSSALIVPIYRLNPQQTFLTKLRCRTNTIYRPPIV